MTDAAPEPISWTLTDHFGEVALGGFGLPNGFPADGGDPPVPGLVLSTNDAGEIVSWAMVASVGSTGADGWFRGTVAGIFNPPVFCGDECFGLDITDVVAVRVLSDTEWDALVLVPEPGTLTLLGSGLLVMARRRRSSRRS